MRRRDALPMVAGAAWAAGAACVALGTSVPRAARAHTPYRQWEVYRRKHLLIGCHRDDPASYAFAKGLVGTLAARLPEARSRVARGPSAGRIASLLATEQMEIAVLQRGVAAPMAAGSGDFVPYGPIALRTLLELGDHLVVARADFPAHHAWLVTRALEERRARATNGAPALPEHPGASAFRAGGAMPHPPEDSVERSGRP